MTKYEKLLRDHVDEIKAMRAEKMSYVEMSKELGVSSSTIRKAVKTLEAQGIIPVKGKPIYSRKRDRLAQIIDGHTKQECADELGVDIDTISNWILELGLQGRALKGVVAKACHGNVKDTLASMIGKGKSLQEMSEELGVSSGVVRKSISECGLDEELDASIKRRRVRREQEHRRNSNIEDTWREELRPYMEARASVQDMLDGLGITKATLYKRMRRAGYGDRIEKRVRADSQERAEQMRAVISMQKDGMSAQDIADALGISKARVLYLGSGFEREDMRGDGKGGDPVR